MLDALVRKLLLVLVLGVWSITASAYAIGVYYYPGWSPGARGPDPWAPIKSLSKREPELGWYRDGDKQTLETQIGWMHKYGISYVVFDWFWNKGGPMQEQSLKAYLDAPNRADVPFALLWANHWQMNQLSDFDNMVAYWTKEYLGRPEYLRIDGKPVIFIFSPDQLVDNAKRMGVSDVELLERARVAARKAGLPGVYFVMATPALEFWAKQMAPKLGFNALSAYNYHNGFRGTPESKGAPSYNYPELDQAYRTNWDWLLKNAPVPYIVPMTSGWDKTPWGGSGDKRHDQSNSTPDEFEQHLRAAKTAMDTNPDKTLRMGVICCWNEYGEGSVIEPTKRDGFTYLERVKKVFGAAS